MGRRKVQGHVQVPVKHLFRQPSQCHRQAEFLENRWAELGDQCSGIGQGLIRDLLQIMQVRFSAGVIGCRIACARRIRLKANNWAR